MVGIGGGYRGGPLIELLLSLSLYSSLTFISGSELLLECYIHSTPSASGLKLHLCVIDT